MEKVRSSLAVLALALLAGCSSTHAVYDSSPAELESARRELGSVGVVLGGYALVRLDLPAKGPLGGAKRGLALGAVWPVVIGLFTPVPFGVLFGAALTPVGALGGAVYGALAAPPAAAVEAAAAEIDEAVVQSSEPGLGELLRAELVRVGAAKTALAFEELREDRPHDAPEPDAVLEIVPDGVGLRGGRGIDPRSSAFLDVEVRLIRTADESVLYAERFRSASVRRSRFFEWASAGGARFTAEAVRFPAELAEKIVDDLFLVLPVLR